jgi:hypothetical protein
MSTHATWVSAAALLPYQKDLLPRPHHHSQTCVHFLNQREVLRLKSEFGISRSHLSLRVSYAKIHLTCFAAEASMVAQVHMFQDVSTSDSSNYS